MKKLFGMVFILFLLMFLYQLAFMFLIGSRTTNYKIKDGDTTIEVSEVLRTATLTELDSYSLTFEVDDTKFNLLTYNNFQRINKIVKVVKYYKETDLGCLFVQYKDELVLHDVICKTNNYMIAYNNMEKPSDSLKEFVGSLKEYGYDASNWKSNEKDRIKVEKLSFYIDNLPNNHYIGVTHQKGYYRINRVDYIYDAEIFTLQQLNARRIHGFIGDKYMAINDLQSHIFEVSSSGEERFEVGELSSSAYSIGVQDNSLYVYDPTTKKEYEVNMKTKKMLEIGNEETGIIYYANGELIRKPLNEISIDSLYFKDEYKNDYTNSDYEKILRAGEKSGYYYLFKKEGNIYKVYRSTIEDKENVMFLFNTKTIDRVYFVEDFIYCVSDAVLYSYSDGTGLRRVIDNTDFVNKKTLLNVFSK